MKLVISMAIVVSLSALASGATVGTFSGGDAGEGLDLDGNIV